MNIKNIIRKITSVVLRYSPSEKFSNILLWPFSKRFLGKNYSEIVEIKKGLFIRTYGDMEDMVNKLLLFTSNYMPLAWEPGTARLVEVLSVKSKCVIVAGSHIGYYPLIISSVNPSSNIFAFEPNPINYERCQENVLLNKFNNIEVLEYALGSISSQQKMFFDFGQSSLVDSSRPHAGSGIVNVISLDDFLKDKNERPDLLILDAEGYEPYILKGGEKIINEKYPDIIFELNPRALESAGSSAESLCQSLIQKGYFLYVIDEGKHRIFYKTNMAIKLVSYVDFSIKDVSFVNIFATIYPEKIQTYVHTD